MSRNTNNATKGNKLVYSFGEQDETLDDIIMQIWNDGAEGVFYDKNDFQEFKRRIRKSLGRRKPQAF